MPKVAKRKPKDIQRYVYELIVLLSAENIENTGQVVTDLLTPMEQEMLAKRIQIIKMLLTGKKYHEIQEALNVQRSTIAHMQSKLTLSSTKRLEKNIIAKLPH